MTRFLLGVGLGATLMYFLDPIAGPVRQAALQRRLTGLAEADLALGDRVRGALSDLSSHPRAITITARRGVVTLSGPVLTSEAAGLLAGVARLPGVSRVVNQLELHPTADVMALRSY